jgi:DNA ligase D-like protein (predicted 3'-phosphoesterase)
VTLFCNGTEATIIDAVSELATKRIRITGQVSDPALRDQVRRRAVKLGLTGWVRLKEDGTLCVLAEGEPRSLDKLTSWLTRRFDLAEDRAVPFEGHEQFAIRGVPAGVFVVQEHQARAHHFDLRLEVDGVMRSWAVPRGPSMDPTVKRLAVEVEDHSLAHNEFEGPTPGGGVIIWDRGNYERGGRVPWPEALERGHAVFVLHGQKLRGGFALQRTSAGSKPQWLLIKRRDEDARPGSDIVAERPESVHSGRTLSAVQES